MRTVADTNVVVSGLLWSGPSRRILDLARDGELQLFTSPQLLEELEDVLHRRKLARRLSLAGVAPWDLVAGYAALARVVLPVHVERVVLEDPDDDAVLACAVAARAEVIVSGDAHLLSLNEHRGIRIFPPTGFLEDLSSRKE
jgi:putative PIN family toxin of toxin-antitoxin system